MFFFFYCRICIHSISSESVSCSAHYMIHLQWFFPVLFLLSFSAVQWARSTHFSWDFELYVTTKFKAKCPNIALILREPHLLGTYFSAATTTVISFIFNYNSQNSFSLSPFSQTIIQVSTGNYKNNTEHKPHYTCTLYLAANKGINTFLRRIPCMSFK